MPINELYSQKGSSIATESESVFLYDEIPQKLRRQVIFIWDRCLEKMPLFKFYEKLVAVFREEYGVKQLAYRPDILFSSKDNSYEDRVEIENFLDDATDVQALDVIEFSFRHIYNQRNINNSSFKKTIEEAISDLNKRFKQHGLGYLFESGELIRIDSQFMHQEAVKPVISLLKQGKFSGPNEEFLKGLRFHHHGDEKEAVQNVTKALESMLKIALKKLGELYT